MAINDIFELVDEQSQAGQTINNVYYFQATDALIQALQVAEWYRDNFLPSLAAEQDDNLSHFNIRVRNLFNAADLAEVAVAVSGGIIQTEELPEFIAISCRFDHNLGGTRPGGKRWGGQPEVGQDEGVWTAAKAAAMQAIGDLLVNPLAPAVSMNHVIVDRVCDEFDPANPARCIRWRLPENQGEANTGEVNLATVQTQVTTQNSRKWYT